MTCSGLTRPRDRLCPNLHLHGLQLDGAYGEDAHGRRRFFTAPAPSPAEGETILARIVRRARALLASGHEPDLDDELELELAQACSASVRTEGTETHRPDEAPDELLGHVLLPTRRKARIDGWDLDAEVCVKEHERDRLEHVARYLLRPPIALDRLKLLGPTWCASSSRGPGATARPT